MTAHDIGIQLAPFFVALCAGMMAAHQRWIPPTAAILMTRFVLFGALPALIIYTLNKPGALVSVNVLFMLAHLVGVLVVSIIMVVISQRVYALATIPAFLSAYCASFPNIGFLGLPVLLALLGDWAAAPLITILVVELAILWPLALLLVDRQAGITLTMLKALKNPLLLAAVLGFLLAALGFTLPPVVNVPLQILGSISGPAALFALGASVVTLRSGQTRDHQQVVVISVMKLLIHPLVAWFVMKGLFTLDPRWCDVGILLAAMPTAATVFLYAQHCHVQTQVTSKAILLSTVGAMLTLPIIATITLNGL